MDTLPQRVGEQTVSKRSHAPKDPKPAWPCHQDIHALSNTRAHPPILSSGMSSKRKGSRNQEKARRRVARLHARVADARRDFHHQLSTRLVRTHQTVCVETLNVAGLGRSNLAKSIHDAGWGQFTAMLEYKARLYGRTLVKVDQWYPSSRLCSACGHRDGPKPLKVRVWTCPNCGATHARDVNAAKNILAAGLAVTACGPGVRPERARAVGDEAGTDLAGAA